MSLIENQVTRLVPSRSWDYPKISSCMTKKMERPPRHRACNSIGRNPCNMQRRSSPRAARRRSSHRCTSTGRPTSTRHPTMGAHSGKLVMSARARLERLPTGLVRGSRYRHVRDRKGPPRWKCLRARAQRVNIAEQRHSAVHLRGLGWRRARARCTSRFPAWYANSIPK